MVGNVWEWTASVFRTYPYRGERAGDAESRETRVVRGRSWDGIPWNLRVSSRDNYPVSDRYYFLGFRCARDESP